MALADIIFGGFLFAIPWLHESKRLEPASTPFPRGPLLLLWPTLTPQTAVSVHCSPTHSCSLVTNNHTHTHTQGSAAPSSHIFTSNSPVRCVTNSYDESPKVSTPRDPLVSLEWKGHQNGRGNVGLHTHWKASAQQRKQWTVWKATYGRGENGKSCIWWGVNIHSILGNPITQLQKTNNPIKK